jgi:glutamate-1-semialdehyde 2,1-aminomutase
VEFHEAYWMGMLNEGVFPPPHDASQQWTLSVQRDMDGVDAFAGLADDLAAAQE